MGLASQENQYLTGRTVLKLRGCQRRRRLTWRLCGSSRKTYEEAKRLLSENRDAMDQIAAFLIEKETITGKEFMEIFRRVKGLPEPEPKKRRPRGFPIRSISQRMRCRGGEEKRRRLRILKRRRSRRLRLRTSGLLMRKRRLGPSRGQRTGFAVR